MSGKARGTTTRRALLGGAVAGALWVAVGDARAGDDVDVVLAKIARARAAVHTMRGPFTQTRTIGLLATDVRSHGTFTLVRPDRLRWELDPPDAVTFWIGPEGLGYRTAHEEGHVAPATAKIAAALDDMRTMLGGDLSRLRERWNLRLVRSDAAGVEMEAERRGDEPSAVRTMRFALGPDLVRPTHVLLAEGPHDRTSIDFRDLAVNVPVDAASMRLPP